MVSYRLCTYYTVYARESRSGIAKDIVQTNRDVFFLRPLPLKEELCIVTVKGFTFFLACPGAPCSSPSHGPIGTRSPYILAESITN